MYFIINWKFYFINVFFNQLEQQRIYYTRQKIVPGTAHSKGLQMKSARIKTRSKECHNYYWHTNDCVPIEMYLTIKFN